MARRAGDSAQGRAGARRVVPNPSFDESPRGFNRIEVMRVGRQGLHGGAALFDEEAHLRSQMR